MSSSELPFDRSFPESFRRRFPLEQLRWESGDRVRVVVEAIENDAHNPDAFAVLFEMSLVVDDVDVEVIEAVVVLVPASCGTEPARAEQELERLLSAMPGKVSAVADSIIRAGIDVVDDRVADEQQSMVMDALFELVFALQSISDNWRPGTPQCRDWLDADQVVVTLFADADDIAFDLFRLATSPARGIPGTQRPARPGRPSSSRDAYRIDDGRVMRLVDALDPDEVRTLEPDLVISDFPPVPPSERTRVIQLWKWDPAQDYGDHALGQFQSKEVYAGIEWVLAGASEEIALERLTRPSDTRRLPVAHWLIEGLSDGRWSDPNRRPPIVKEVDGWLAFVALARATAATHPSPVAIAQAKEAFDVLIRLGCKVEPSATFRLFTNDGSPIGRPVEEAQAASEELRAHLAEYLG